MPRYIDADKMVSKDNAYTTFPHDLAGCDDNDLVRWINEQPTADVAPKTEVAREIFEEIYEDCFDQFGYINYEALAELKKKYTEGAE